MFRPQGKSKWIWMMDYCQLKKIPPAHEWAWNQAAKAYHEFLESLLPEEG